MKIEDKTTNQAASQNEMMYLKLLRSYLWKFTCSSHSQRQSSTIIQELCHEFSLEDLRKSTNNFDESSILGHGGFGTVYKGCLQYHDGATDCTIALKRLREKSSQLILEFNNEIELLCQLRHPNLVSLVGFCNHENEKILVYEYASNGSLDRYLRGGHSEVRSWKKSLEICIGVARGLHYLHAGAKRTIIHLGIKPTNILLDHAMTPKLSNFSFSVQGARFMSKPKPIQTDRIVGTWGYLAWEYAREGTITDKCDVFSFGIVLLEVVCGMKDNVRNKLWELMSYPVEENIDPDIKGNIAPECWEVFMDITRRCLKHEPDDRPTMGEVEVQLEHALSLQEQADIQNTNGDYTLSSKTIIKRGPEQELDYGDYTLFNSIANTEYSYTEDDDVEDIFSR